MTTEIKRIVRYLEKKDEEEKLKKEFTPPVRVVTFEYPQTTPGFKKKNWVEKKESRDRIFK